jgi:WD40 repeat protein
MRLLPMVVVLVGVLEGCGSSGSSNTVSNGGAGAGAGGMGGSAGAGSNGSPEWLAFQTPDGIFAYDANTFPSTATVKLGPPPGGDYLSDEGPLWSRDGTRIVYISGDALELWDMTGSAPSAPVTLAQGLKPESTVAATSWSPDGKSLVLLQNQTLYALDPTRPMPPRNPIGTNVQTYHGYQWAPTGDGLLYADTTGLNLVHIAAGVPGTPQHLDDASSGWEWSPNSKYVGTEDSTQVWMFDVSGATLKSTSVYPLVRPFAASPYFNSDGTYFAFNDGDGTGALHYASTAAPDMVFGLNSPTDGTPGYGYRWHPNRPSVLAFNAVPAPDSMPMGDWFLADVSVKPVAPTPIPLPVGLLPQMWMPDGLSLLISDDLRTQFWLIDLSVAKPALVAFQMQSSTIRQWRLSPDKTVLGYSTNTTLRLSTLASPSDLPKTLTVNSNDMDAFSWEWSPDGRYIMMQLTTNKSTEQSFEIVRADGPLFSWPVTLSPSTVGKQMGFAWQPTVLP